MQKVRKKVGMLQKADGGKTDTDRETADVLCMHCQSALLMKLIRKIFHMMQWSKMQLV